VEESQRRRTNMSHYCVGVIINNTNNIEADIEKILAPYDENLEVEPYIYKTKAELIQQAKNYKLRIQREIEEDVDHTITEYEQSYLNAQTDEDFYNLEHEYYNTYNENGDELSTYNPQSKWDWWVIGGRWSKENNILQIKDFVLYDTPTDQQIEHYKKCWEYLNNEIEVENPFKEFGYELGMFKKEYLKEKYGSLENLIKSKISNLPYSFVDENGWYEQGKMGWFGMDNATKESIDGYTKFAENYFRDIKNQDKYIVFVDCHI
jgi:hypothetical protein